jgi:hypothetical protein
MQHYIQKLPKAFPSSSTYPSTLQVPTQPVEEEEEEEEEDDDDDDDGDDEEIMYIHTQYPEAQRNLERENKNLTEQKGCTGFIDVVDFVTPQHMTQHEGQA